MSQLNSKGRSPVKSNQLGMRELVVFYTGASGDVISGPDSKMFEPVVDNGGGSYTFIVKSKARATLGKNLFLKGFSSLTADCNVQVTALADDRVTVQCHVAGAAADADITLCIGAHDWKLEYE